MKQFNALVVDDHPLFRNGFKNLLHTFSFIETVFEAGNGEEALVCIEKNEIDFVFLDVDMPIMDGVKFLKHIYHNKTIEQLKVITVSSHDFRSLVLQCYELGVSGYINKTASLLELKTLFNNLTNDELYFSKDIRQLIFRNLGAKNLIEINDREILTPKEIEVLKMLANSFSIKEIADKLFVSESTVKTHRASIYKKTNSVNAVAAAVYALKCQLVNIRDL